MSKLPEKVNIQQIQEGESVSPTVANRPHDLLGKDIDNLRNYLKDSPLEHFNLVDITTTYVVYGDGVIKNTSGQYIKVAQGSIQLGNGDHYIQLNPTNGTVVKDTSFQPNNIALYHINISGSMITVNDYRTWYFVGGFGGSGGGDADTLGGQQPSYFLDLTNHTGTITDSQHGSLGGGSLHTTATTTESGFMSPVDKTKLDDAVTGVVNQGTGIPVFIQKNGDDLLFKTITAGLNVTINDTGDEIVIGVAGGAGGGLPVNIDGPINEVSQDLAYNQSSPDRKITIASRFSNDVGLEFRHSGTDFLQIDISGIYWANNDVNRSSSTILNEFFWRLGPQVSQNLTFYPGEIQFRRGLGNIKNVSDPIDNQDVATKKYVDDSIANNIPTTTQPTFAALKVPLQAVTIGDNILQYSNTTENIISGGISVDFNTHQITINDPGTYEVIVQIKHSSNATVLVQPFILTYFVNNTQVGQDIKRSPNGNVRMINYFQFSAGDVLEIFHQQSSGASWAGYNFGLLIKKIS